jgi:hypothetical protein
VISQTLLSQEREPQLNDAAIYNVMSPFDNPKKYEELDEVANQSPLNNQALQFEIPNIKEIQDFEQM